jgi:flagellar biosynthesis component FlhA
LSPGVSDLSPEFVQMINQMRERVRQRFGLTIPGVNFTTLQDDYAPSGVYQFSIMEVPVDSGQTLLDKKFAPGPPDKLAALAIKGDALFDSATGPQGIWIAEADGTKVEENGVELWTPAEYLLRHLEAVLEQNLAKLMNHQEAMNLLLACASEACARIAKSPEELTAFTLVLRELLSQGAPIIDFNALTEHFIRSREESADVKAVAEHLHTLAAFNASAMETITPDTASLTLFLSKTLALDRSRFEPEFVVMQETLFNESGVICPKVEIQDDEDLPDNTFQLQINEHRLDLVHEITRDKLWLYTTVESPELAHLLSNIGIVLRQNIGELLSAELVQYYLATLRISSPAVVDTALGRFDAETLTLILRKQVESGSSIRNMAGILEELLATNLT